MDKRDEEKRCLKRWGRANQRSKEKHEPGSSIMEVKKKISRRCTQQRQVYKKIKFEKEEVFTELRNKESW